METISAACTLDDFKAVFGERLMALSRVQDLVSRNDLAQVTIRELVDLELQALAVDPKQDRVTVEGRR